MSVFDRPTSNELLEAVIDFIDAEIKSDSYPANKKFKFQIVLNVLNIVKREVETGEEINEKFSELGSNLIGENEFKFSHGLNLPSVNQSSTINQQSRVK